MLFTPTPNLKIQKNETGYYLYCLQLLILFQNIKSQDSLASEQPEKHPALSASLTFIGNLNMKVHIMGIKDSSLFVHKQKTSANPDPFHRTNIYIESAWDKYNYRTIESIKVPNNKFEILASACFHSGRYCCGCTDRICRS